MIKKWLCALLSVCLLLSQLPVAAEDALTAADEEDVSAADFFWEEPGGDAEPGPDEGEEDPALYVPRVTPPPPEEPDPPAIDWPQIWRTSEAWYYEADGRVTSGALNDLCHGLLDRGAVDEAHPQLIMLCADRVLVIEEIRRWEIKCFLFKPDTRVLKDADEKTLMIEERGAGGDADDPEAIVSFYIWLEAEAEPTAAPTAEPTAELTAEPTAEPTTDPTAEPTSDPTSEPTAEPADDLEDIEQVGALRLRAKDFVDGAWSCRRPVFVMSGIPEGERYWEYAVVPYGKTILLVEDGIYSPEDEGEYTLRFLMLDDLGDVVHATDTYTVKLDFTPPEISDVNAETGEDYAMEIAASDALSGLDAVSIDGGETWTEIDGDEPFAYVAEEETVIEAGLLLVRDRAGNTAAWPDEVILTRQSGDDPEPYQPGDGYIPDDDFIDPGDDPTGVDPGGDDPTGYVPHGGGDGSPGATYQPHASGNGPAKHDYDQVSVPQDEETPMHTLTLDGEELELTLTLDAAQGFEFDESYEAMFLVETAFWADPPQEEEPDASPTPRPSPTPAPTPLPEDIEPNTMILDAQVEPQVLEGGSFQYSWTINGAVLRQLRKSGVNYLALKIGDQLTALPANGFLAGERYTELKMQGVSTRRFQYNVVMRFTPPDPEAEPPEEGEEPVNPWLTEIYVTVEEETTLLTEDELEPIYMTNVCVGPAVMMDVPYGTWIEEEAEDGAAPSAAPIKKEE